jgi:hypothetical protein
VAKNYYFENYSNSMEQELIEDLVIESIRIFGIDCWYIPRTISAKDDIFNEDSLSIFNDAYMLEMYVKNVDGFEGEGDFLSKFGLQIRDSMTLTVANRVFDFEVGAGTEQVRPNEGDLIYFPLNRKMFQVMHVEHEAIFYQMGQLQTYDLRCELFEYSGERFETGQEFIDDLYDSRDLFVTQANNVFNVSVSNNVFAIREEGSQSNPVEQPVLENLFVGSTYIFDQSDGTNSGVRLEIYDGPSTTQDSVATIQNLVGTPGANNAYTSFTPETPGTYHYLDVNVSGIGGTLEVLQSKLEAVEPFDATADNESIETFADNILDFSEDNPFGENNF